MKITYNFSKQEHISKPAEFGTVFRLGKSYSNEWLVIYILDRKDNKIPRIGWVISAKTGKANRRFRIKRLIREVFRLNKSIIRKGLDIVVIPAKKAAAIDSYDEMKKILFGLLKDRALR